MFKPRKLPIDIQPPEIVAREMKYPRRDIWILLAVCVLLRLVLTPINMAEYTDGILQAVQFVDPAGSIWPPLYSALIYPLKFVFGFEWAGRLISAVASGLAILPLYWMTRRAFGTRAALYAGIFYIVAPVANRWGIRLMTDASFSLFFWWACERICYASDERNEELAYRAIGFASVFTVLAALTRYQGLMLVPPLLAVAFIVYRRFKRVPVIPLVWLAGLAILPVWVLATREGFIHDDQFTQRAFDSPVPLWKVLALNGEAFVALMPYFLTWPVAVFTLIGIFQVRMRRGACFGFLAVYVGLTILVAQSAFSSFQERYFLPGMGFLWVLAGAGMYSVQERWLRPGRVVRRRLFPWLMIATYGWSVVFTAAVLIGQRTAFGDIARASRLAGELTPENLPIYTNEIYRDEPRIAADKVKFYAEHPAVYLELNPGRPDLPPPVEMEPGTLIVLSSVYGGDAYLAWLRQHYVLELVENPDNPEANPYAVSLLPLLPDIMSIPNTAQNPLAWNFRYTWQDFSTAVYRVRGPRGR